ncbi:MAG: hypothetical protein WCJ25_00985 [Candidatus Moraniibacteriota bacterium]
MASDIGNTSHKSGTLFSGNRGRTFAVTALFASLLSFVALSEGSRGYQADLSILVIPGKRTAPSTVEVMNDVVFLSKTPAFRSVFFKDAESVPAFLAMDSADNFSDDAKRKLFDSMLSVSASGKGSVLTVRAVAGDAEDAKDIARAAALSLSRYASRYYDVEATADFRIVDGPSVSARMPNGFMLITESVGLGIVFSSLLFLSFSVVPGAVSYIHRRRMSLSAIPFSADIFQPKRPVSPLLPDVALPDIADHGTELSTVTDDGSDPVMQETVMSSQETDRFFDPAPIASEVSSASATRTAPTEKKAPAPLDIPTFSEEEARFLKEFTFEAPSDAEEEMNDMNAVDIPVETAVKTVSDEVPDTVPVVPAEDAQPVLVEGDERIIPSRADYQRRLNELLRG